MKRSDETNAPTGMSLDNLNSKMTMANYICSWHKRSLFFAVAALVFLSSPAVRAQSTFLSRSNLLLNYLSTRGCNVGQLSGPHRAGRTGFWTTQGRLDTGITNSTTWDYLSAAIANADGSQDAGGANGGFSGWPGMDTFLRWNQMFPTSISNQYYTKYTTMGTYGNGATPNQRMMWAVACRLACETWGTNAVTQVSNAKYWTTDPSGRDVILSYCENAVQYNFRERWATIYLEYTLGPLRSIVDLSTDPVLRQQARMAWNWGMMDLASGSFNGRWSLPSARGGMAIYPEGYGISENATWLLYGGPTPSNLLNADQSMLYTQYPVPPVATPPPTLPEMVLAGTNRATPYTRYGMARLYETQLETTYMRTNYSLFSQFEADTTLNPDGTIAVKDFTTAGVPSNDWEAQRWGLMWDGSPANNAPAGLSFSPPTSYGWATGSGISPYEKVVQSEGTLVGIVNIPTNGNQWTVDEIPTNVTAVINDITNNGHLFLNYNTVLVSIYRTDPGVFTWPPASQTFCSKRGYALETASPSDYPQSTPASQLAAFRSDVLTYGGVNTNYVFNATNRMIYTNRLGVTFDITYGQGGIVNGNPLNYAAWPLNSSPWSYQQQMGNMFVFGTDRTLIWDYQNWTELTNNRPIITTTSPVIGTGGLPVNVNLATLVSDVNTPPTPSTNLLYRILNATNGTAQLLADGYTAQFTPAANFSGTGSFTFAAGNQFPHARQIFYYDLQETNLTASNSIPDASTENRNGTLNIVGLASATADTNTPPALGAHSTQSLHLVSSGFGAARLSRQVYPASLPMANEDWTFSTWFCRSAYADDDIIFYVGTGGGFGGSGDELQLYCPAQTRTIALNHYNTNNVLDVNLVSAAAVNTNEWHHVAVTFQCVAFNTGNVRLYLDGALAGVVSNVTWSLKQSGPLYFGGPAVNKVFSRNFNGWLDDLSLWRWQFPDADIARLATGPATRLGGLEVTNTVTIITAPLAPAGLNASLVNNSIVLSWNAVNGAAGYNIKRALSASGPFTNIFTGLTATNYTDTSAAIGVNYFYAVSAVNAAGESATSAVVSAMRSAVDLSLWQSGKFSSWQNGARIYFPGYNRSEVLTNFPLLVTLGTNISGFRYGQFALPAGADLRFTDAGGTTELPYEVDTWNTNGTSSFWVQVPALTTTSSICAFWNNPQAGTAASPDKISNLAMWLKADALTNLTDGQTVTNWPDSSTNGINATLAAGAPQFKTNVLNGRPVVRFDTTGNNYYNFKELTNINTVFWVLKESTNGLHFMLGDSTYYDFHRGLNGEIFYGADASTNVVNGTTRLMGTVVNPTTTLLGSASNGVASVFRLVSVVTAGNCRAGRISLDRTLAGRSWNGDIAEIIIYNRALTPAEESSVGLYLTQKYGLTTTYVGGAPAYTTDGSVWTNNYLGVFHLDETNGQHFSSTAGAAPTRLVQVAQQGTAAGVVGGADNFNGTSNYVSLPTFGTSAQVTVECWVNLNGTPGGSDIGLVSSDPWTDGITDFKTSSSFNVKAQVYGTGVAAISANNVLSVGKWAYAAYTIAGSGATDLNLYVNGQLAASATGYSANNLTGLNLGREYSGRYLNGRLDEVRVSGVPRSANWLWATWLNIASNGVFNTVASVSTLASNTVQIATLPASGVTTSSATQNGNLLVAGSGTAAVTIYWGATDQGTNAAAWPNSISLGSLASGAFSTNLTGLNAGQLYAYRCFATNSSGASWAAQSQNFTTTVSPPASLAGVPANGQVLLAWSPSGNGSYLLKRGTTSGGPYAPQLAGIIGTNFTDPTATIGTTYYYVVDAVNGSGTSADSVEAAVLPVAAPTGLIASPTNAMVNLIWNSVAGATSYNVNRALSSGGPFSVIQSNLVATSFSDTSVTNGTNYFYFVTANSPGFQSANSATVSAMPLVTLPIPTGLAGFPASGGANLTWNYVTNATTYNVKRSTTNGGPYTVIASNLLAPSFTDSGLTNGKNYYYVVSALFGLSESANSTQVLVVPQIPPTVFTNTAAGNWSAVTWLPNPPGQPISAPATVLVFTNGTAIASTNDGGLFLLNTLDLLNQSVTLAGGELYLIGSNATVSSSQNVAHTINCSLGLDDTTTFSVATNTVTVSGTISGAGGINKTGSGTLALSGTNTFTGLTTVGAGFLEVLSSDAFGEGSDGVIVSNTATLQLSGGVTIDSEPLTAIGDGSLISMDSLNGTNTWADDITISGHSCRFGCEAGALTIEGDVDMSSSTNDQFVIQGNGNVTVTGAIIGGGGFGSSGNGSGMRTLLGDNNFTGDTIIGGGTVVVNSINSVAGGNPPFNTSGLGAPTTVANGTIYMGSSGNNTGLTYTGSGETTDRVIDLDSVTGGVTLDQSGGGVLEFTSSFIADGAGSKTLTLQGSGVGQIDGAIVNNSAANRTSVTKTGTGTWILAGASTYTGTTTVSAGELIVSGSVAGSVVANGGTLRGPGTVTSNVTINASAAMEVDIIGIPGGGASYDQLFLASPTSTLTLAGNLDVVVTNEIPLNTPFTVVTNAGSPAVSGKFAGLTNNATFAASEYNWQISYTAGSGNEITLTAISPVLAPPNAPLNLIATPASWQEIDLTWTNNATNAAGVVVERASSPSGPFFQVGNVPTNITSFADTTVNQLTTYYYRVRSYRNFASLSPSSNIASATTPLMPVSGYQTVITFTNYNRSEVLTNFPVLVVLGTNVPGFDYGTFQAPVPDELRFKAMDGISDLDYEVDTWNTGGQSYVWVKIPVFTNGCSIIARWGNPLVVLPPATAGNGAVWTNGFIGVWHLSETSGEHLDSSPMQGIARATQPDVEGTAAGIVGGADDFYGLSGYVSLPDMGLVPAVTVECWANLNAVPADALRGLVSSDPWGVGITDFRVNNALQVQAATDEAGLLSSPSNSLSVGNWFYAGYEIAGAGAGKASLFLNGIVVTNGTGVATNDLSDVNIAREYNARFLNACVDEVRISNVARSTNWIWATYQNIGANTAFNDYGSVAQLTPAVPLAPQFAALQMKGGQFQFQINGTPDYIQTLQVSTNLTAWQSLFSVTPLTMPLVWTDTNTSQFPHRFYRVLVSQ